MTTTVTRGLIALRARVVAVHTGLSAGVFRRRQVIVEPPRAAEDLHALSRLSSPPQPATVDSPAELPTPDVGATTGIGDAAAEQAAVVQIHALEAVPASADVLVAPAQPEHAIAVVSAAAAEAAEPISAAAPSVASAPAAPPGKRSDLGLIRAWAREHGYTVADRGRIAAAVIAAYDERR